jgi:hypothetical protein
MPGMAPPGASREGGQAVALGIFPGGGSSAVDRKGRPAVFQLLLVALGQHRANPVA